MLVQTLTYIQLNPKWQWSVSCVVSDLKSLSRWPGIQHPIHCQSRNPAKTKRRTKSPTWVAIWLVMFLFTELQVFSRCFWTGVYLMRQNKWTELYFIYIYICISILFVYLCLHSLCLPLINKRSIFFSYKRHVCIRMIECFKQWFYLPIDVWYNVWDRPITLRLPTTII